MSKGNPGLSPRWLVAIYLTLVLTPLVLAAALMLPPRSILDEIASGAGMLAFAIVLVEFSLSGRFRAVSRRAGIDVTMRVHQLIGRTAVVAALVHPFLYRAERDAAHPWDVTRELTAATDFGLLWSGIVAWLLLPTLVLVSLTRGEPNHRYEIWRWMHGVGAVAIAALLLHHGLTAGRYSGAPVLAAYWIGLTGMAALCMLWIYAVVPWHQLRNPWEVTRVEKAGEKIWQVEIAPKGPHRMDYDAGQFAWLNLGASPFLHRENPFSIASAPSSGRNLSFLIKELGDSTALVGKTRTGSTAYVDGPHGALTLAGRSEKGIGLIAGGIGIAPMIGLLRQLSLEEDKRPRKLLYADKSPEQIVHRSELTALATQEATEVVFVYDEPPEDWTGESGRIDAALLSRRFTPDEFGTWLFVVCGPPQMMNAVEIALLGLGVEPHRILSERFDYD